MLSNNVFSLDKSNKGIKNRKFVWCKMVIFKFNVMVKQSVVETSVNFYRKSKNWLIVDYYTY